MTNPSIAIRILILGGTTEARQLAERLAPRSDLETIVSLAGRTEKPVSMPVPVRTGGFGGPEGLATFLADNAIDVLVDATHPYAARISRNAALAAKSAHIPLVALRRAPWRPVAGDAWVHVASVEAAVDALGREPRRVFLALGRQELRGFEAAPQHFYLIRSVDPVEPPLPSAVHILDRGPFREADDLALFRQHAIDTIVAKNSGGDATYSKIAAARTLGIPVLLVRRPNDPDVPAAETVAEAQAMIDHAVTALAKRGE